MKHRFLQVVRRAPVVSFFAVMALGLGGVVALGRTCFEDRLAAASDVEVAEGRGILGRVWFDRWPEDARTEANYLILMAGGIGLHEQGAAYKYAVEMFEFERTGRHLDIEFLHAGTKAQVDFVIERCSDLPPFDACLTLQSELRGPRRYYGFADDDELTRRLPWMQGRVEQARARAGR